MIGFIRLSGYILAVVLFSSLVFIVPTNKIRLRIFRIWAKVSLQILNVKVITTGELPKNKPLVIVANHFGITEILAIMSLQGVRFVAKSEIGGIPFVGWAMKRTGQIFVCRSRGKAKKHLIDVSSALQEKDSIAIFPEGSTNDGFSLRPFKSTLLRVVEDGYRPCDMTIVPMAIAYTNITLQQRKFLQWTDQSSFKYLWNVCCLGRSQITVDILPEIHITGTGHDAKKITIEIEQSISEAFHAMIKQ